jgi:hypothetical protein
MVSRLITSTDAGLTFDGLLAAGGWQRVDDTGEPSGGGGGRGR